MGVGLGAGGNPPFPMLLGSVGKFAVQKMEGKLLGNVGAEKYFRNIIKSNRNQIVFTIFQINRKMIIQSYFGLI